MLWLYIATLLAANLLLLLPPGALLRVGGALLLIGLLPGLTWTDRFWGTLSPLFRWTIAAALSYSFTILVTLLLSYFPGPVETWQLLVALNLLALLPLLPIKSKGHQERRDNIVTYRPPPPPEAETLLGTGLEQHQSIRAWAPFLFIVLIALLLRTLNLDYSEFQGDESLVMISAAEALEGHEDALFLRSKGPGEVLLPMALWRLTGVITEPIARLPFTAASLLTIMTIYLIGRKTGGQRVGWLAAGIFAFNGFMLAFGRIVQYQALVIWFSALAFLFILEWRESRQQRLAWLGGLCLGVGLLAHYDTVLVVPAILWLFMSGLFPGLLTTGSHPQIAALEKSEPISFTNRRSAISGLIRPILLFSVASLLTALLFYLPFALDPQANRTGDYVGARIGSELRNNLPDFFHFNTFYSSFYYLILTGLLALAVLTWLIWQTRWGRWLGVVILAGILTVILKPTLLAGDQLDLSVLPFALLLGSAFFIPLLNPSNSPTLTNKLSPLTPYSLLPIILWLAVPFLGYNFVVALGLTHIYTIVPAWSLLAGWGWYYFFDAVPEPGENSPAFPTPPLPRPISNGLLAGLALLSTIFLWNAFIRHDVEYWQDYPAGSLPLYWSPYKEPPQAGFFGFAHRAGWKAVGQKIASGELAGDYGSNEEPDVTTWYTRGAPRACDAQPEFYFLADDLIDPVNVPDDLINSTYEQIGQVTLPNQKQMRIIQLKPNNITLGDLADAALADAFDQTAIPPAFARSSRGSIPIEANFNHLIRLIGYDLDTRRAHPGGRIPVTLYWQALAPISANYQVFTHLEGKSGPVAQADGVPVCWSYPTDAWHPGQIIADQHAIQLPPDVPSGNYPLQVGLYLADSFARLDVLDKTNNPISNSVTLTEVQIQADSN